MLNMLPDYEPLIQAATHLCMSIKAVVDEVVSRKITPEEGHITLDGIIDILKEAQREAAGEGKKVYDPVLVLCKVAREKISEHAITHQRVLN